jgi:hypothetical protein
MSVARCREINARLRAAGVTVHEWPGWESRGNGQSSAYEGGIVHHTATAFGSAPSILVNGRSDLPGPLANYAGNADGSLTVIAAHPANHAGASGGRSMGPLPVTSLFNKRVLGLEIVYPGTVPMRDAQYRAALIWTRVVADVVGWGDRERVRAHAETSITGKWDPGDQPGRTINMAAFRAAAQIQPEEDVTLNVAQDAALGQTWGTVVSGTHYEGSNLQTQLGYIVTEMRAGQAALAAAIAAEDLDAEALSLRLEAAAREAAAAGAEHAITTAVLPALRDVLAEALGDDTAEQADAIVDRLAERLRPAA